MDPHIEQPGVWHDFHEKACPAISAALVPQVRPGYSVWIDENLFIHEPPAADRLAGRADAALADKGRPRHVVGGATAGGAAVAEPAPLVGSLAAAAIDFERLSFVEIRDRHSREVVTAIELLSPTNKRRGPHRAQYLAKRDRYIYGRVNLVEIDLLRGGPRMPVEGLPACDYCVLVSRWDERPRIGLWPLNLRDPLPTVPIPLKPRDPDAVLDLRAVLDRVYDESAYGDVIYDHPPDPPLGREDAAWAAGLLATDEEASAAGS